MVMAPCDPVSHGFNVIKQSNVLLQSLSHAEFLALLDEAKAIQQRFGISLKDACHRLYFAETSKLETIDAAEKTMAAILSRLEKVTNEETIPPIAKIDSGDFDKHVLTHGKWTSVENDPAEGTVMMNLD